MSDDDHQTRKGERHDERTGAEVPLEDHILAVRLGHGANCSSIGSVVDTLFASAVVTGAIFAAVCAALSTEKVTVVGSQTGETSKASETGEDTKDERGDGGKAGAPEG